jgi:hypothetical protein
MYVHSKNKSKKAGKDERKKNMCLEHIFLHVYYKKLLLSRDRMDTEAFRQS